MKGTAVSGGEPNAEEVTKLHGTMDTLVLPEPFVQKLDLAVKVERPNGDRCTGQDATVLRIFSGGEN